MATVHPTPETKAQPGTMDMSDMAKAIGTSSTLKVKQTFSVGDGCIGACCEIKNRYNIYDPVDNRLVMMTTEESGCCVRTCCSPDHSFLTKIRFGDGSQKISNDWGRKEWRANQAAFKALESTPAAYTIEREGCTSKCCLSCFACSSSCQDQMTFHKGDLTGDPGTLSLDAAIFVAQQAPASESMFEPKINVFPAGSDTAVLAATGPTFFGGCSEYCCATTFEVKNADGKVRGSVLKPAPDGCCSLCTQCCTNFDEFDMNMEPDTTPEEKAAILTSTFLVDYMFFERDPGVCVYDEANKMCIITMCYMYCAGCMCPCKAYIPCPKE